MTAFLWVIAQGKMAWTILSEEHPSFFLFFFPGLLNPFDITENILAPYLTR